jgi:hypothetical protein
VAFGNPSTQGGDLMQIGLEGSYEWYLGIEGGYSEPSSEGSINIPWILSLALSLGNAATEALGTTANVFVEPEWGWDAGEIGRDKGPYNDTWMGGGTGGFIISW